MWRKDGTILRNGLKYSVLRGGELIIRHAQYSDSGTYECVARTNRERVEAFTDLVVRGKKNIGILFNWFENATVRYIVT